MSDKLNKTKHNLVIFLKKVDILLYRFGDKLL